MFFDVRMIGRAIDGEIERNLHPAFAHLFLQPIKIGQRSERRLDRLMPTGFAADRPRHPWITRLAGDRIVPPLAVGVTYGMDRRSEERRVGKEGRCRGGW